MYFHDILTKLANADMSVKIPSLLTGMSTAHSYQPLPTVINHCPQLSTSAPTTAHSYQPVCILKYVKGSILKICLFNLENEVNF